jgi:hypothetical protein
MNTNKVKKKINITWLCGSSNVDKIYFIIVLECDLTTNTIKFHRIYEIVFSKSNKNNYLLNLNRNLL